MSVKKKKTLVRYIKKIPKAKRFLIDKYKEKKYITEQNFPIYKNEKNIDKCRIAVYTCIMGDYDTVKVPLVKFDNVDYFLITNNIEKFKQYENSFKIIKYDDIDDISDTLKNRYVKLNPHNFFKEYDYSIYLDGSIKVINDIRTLVNNINDSTGLAIHAHTDRKCVYDEAWVLNFLKKGNKKKINKQIKSYKKDGFPKKFGLYEACVLVTDLNNPSSLIVYNNWYNEFIKSESLRDQLSLPYILWKNNFKFLDVGIIGNDVYENEVLMKVKHIHETKN